MKPSRKSEDSPLGLGLLSSLKKTIEKIPEPIFLFVIAILIIVLLAAIIGGKELVIEIRLLIGILAALAILAFITIRIYPRQNKKKINKNEGIGTMSTTGFKKIQYLREGLEFLNQNQFQAMISETLNSKEQDDLMLPVSKSSYLNDMSRWEKLNLVEEYLNKHYPDILLKAMNK